MSAPAPVPIAKERNTLSQARTFGHAEEAGMRRVVVTGMGIVSSIGNTTQEVLASLREAKSGVSRADKYAKPERTAPSRGFRAISVPASSKARR